jgi:MFS family permease
VLFFPDPPTPPKKPSLGTVRSLVTRRSVLVPSLLQMLVHVADFAATFTFVPIIARQHGASDLVVSALLSLNLATGLLGNSVSSRLTRRTGAHWTSMTGVLLIAFGVGGAAIAPNLGFVFFFQLCIGLGFGLIYPLCMGLSIRQVPENERNTAMGLHQSFYSIGMFTGPWLSGQLAVIVGIPTMFAIIAALVLVLGTLWSMALRRV